MGQKYNNAARALLASGITDVATSLTVEAAKADLFPTANTGTGSVPAVATGWFKIVLQDSSGNIEIVYVRTRTAGSGVMSDLIRGQEGTTARAFSAGTVVGLRITALDIETSIAAASNSVQLTGNQTIDGVKTFNQTVSGSITGNAGTVTNGVYTTGNQTIDGVKTFNQQIVASGGVLGNVTGNITGNITGNAATVTNGVYTTGDQNIAGVKTFSSFPVLPATLGGFYKTDATTVAFTKTAAGAVSIKAGTRVDVGGRWIEFPSATAVTMPTLTAGEDYAIWCTPAGALQATADPFSSPAAPPVAGARKIGGFHYGLVAPGTTPAGGSFATTGFTNTGGRFQWTQADVDRIAGINEFSLWDLAWRCKGQQRGLALDPQSEEWLAIYWCSTNHIVNGISRNNTDVASGTVLPRIPLAYGGNGSTNYGRFSQYEAEEVAASFGLRLPHIEAFRSSAFGVTEAQSLGGSLVTIPLTTRQPGYTSRIGIEQATGHLWCWARGNSSAGGNAWTAGPNRGDSYGALYVTLLGGNRTTTANSGSRASSALDVAWTSNWNTALRAAGDHLKHV